MYDMDFSTLHYLFFSFPVTPLASRVSQLAHEIKPANWPEAGGQRWLEAGDQGQGHFTTRARSVTAPLAPVCLESFFD